MNGSQLPVAAMEAGSPLRASLRVALLQVGLSAVALTGFEIALFLDAGSGPVAALVAYSLTGAGFVAAGMVAWWRRPSGRIGALLSLCGTAVLASAAGNVADPVLAVVGTVLAQLPIGVLLHLLLAFPSGRLPDRRSRLLAVAGYVVTLALPIPAYMFGPLPGVPPVLVVADRPDLVSLFARIATVAGFVVVPLCALVLLQRLRAADRPQRRVLAAVSAYGIFTILFLTGSAIVARLTGIDPLTQFVVQMVVLAGVPVAFLGGLLRGGFARTAEIEELGAWLGATEGGRPELRDAVAATLGDPSLELLFWLPREHRWADADGVSALLPDPGGPRAAVEVATATGTVGAIVHDAVLLPDAELVRAAGRVVALAMERDRLTAELLAGRAALRRSRARIVESGDRERRRLARDLHDGLQARLVVLALRAGRLAAGTAPPLAEQAEAVRADAEAAIAELRGLVHGIMPDLLVQRGLPAAAQELADRLPLPSTLSLPGDDRRWPATVETAGWFTLAEGVANAVKHSGARKLWLTVGHTDDVLTVEVRDDGAGGAHLDGGGLRGIADRVEAVGGRLHLDSTPGGGTRLRAELPCVS
ncbi:MAG: hypothetical protein J0I34_19060 [Pseudonocardia sp.]|uniref:histidine kinase n=1 Tax=unclassified Pseudonocardia TaxID=2619320 RepID=UPI001AC0CB97|nr:MULTISPECIES: histidine kinase [unclassified Pseudonocardia]MBN9110867.1 hypothetical protein [Pseudonocardia sp.]